MSEDERTPWESDPLTKFVSNLIATMPDLPKMVIAILKYDAPDPNPVVTGMFEFKEAYICSRYFLVFGQSYNVLLFGFESDSTVFSVRFLEVLSTLPFDEAAIYLNGKVQLRVEPVPFGKHRQ